MLKNIIFWLENGVGEKYMAMINDFTPLKLTVSKKIKREPEFVEGKYLKLCFRNYWISQIIHRETLLLKKYRKKHMYNLNGCVG